MVHACQHCIAGKPLIMLLLYSFDTSYNKGITRDILREVKVDLPNAKEEEILSRL